MIPKHDVSKYPYSSKRLLQVLELNRVKILVFMYASLIDLFLVRCSLLFFFARFLQKKVQVFSLQLGRPKST